MLLKLNVLWRLQFFASFTSVCLYFVAFVCVSHVQMDPVWWFDELFTLALTEHDQRRDDVQWLAERGVCCSRQPAGTASCPCRAPVHQGRPAHGWLWLWFLCGQGLYVASVCVCVKPLTSLFSNICLLLGGGGGGLCWYSDFCDRNLHASLMRT